MKIRFVFKYLLVICALLTAAASSAQSVREERRLITSGNKLYVERKYKDAAARYQEALQVNGSSAVAKYNLGMARIRQVTNPKDTAARNAALLQDGVKLLSEVAAMAKEKPGLASKANYNLGNLEFNRENYGEAISYYKQALRIDPDDANARKNLRIAQLKQQNQDNKDQNQDNKDQNQDNKDQNQDNKDQNQDNKDRNQDKQDRNKDNNKQDQKDINQQTASQILQAIDNKESQTRARVNRANKGEKSQAGGRRLRKW